MAADISRAGVSSPDDDAPRAGLVAAIEIVDDGDGMSRETVERIFDPFFSTKARDRGMGMAIVGSVA